MLINAVSSDFRVAPVQASNTRAVTRHHQGALTDSDSPQEQGNLQSSPQPGGGGAEVELTEEERKEGEQQGRALLKHAMLGTALQQPDSCSLEVSGADSLQNAVSQHFTACDCIWLGPQISLAGV